MNEVADLWFESVLRASWQGAVVAGVIWGACRIFPKVPSAVRCWLWWLVCLRMLVAMVPASIGLPLLAPTPVVSASTYLVPNASIAHEWAAPAALTPPSLSFNSWLMMAWVVGILLFGTLTIAQVARTYRTARRAKCNDSGELFAEARRVAKQLGLRRCPKVLVADGEADVVVLGAVRPVVLFSRASLENCSTEERQLVLAHEMAHIRRGDPWLALVPQIARTLFFFHPFAWLASKEFDFARETDCDEIAIRSLNARSDTYGRLLLKLGVRRDADLTLLTPGVSSHFRVLRRRIDMLHKVSELSPLRPRRGATALLALAGMICVTPVALVRAQTPPAKPPVAVKFSDPVPHVSEKWGENLQVKPADPIKRAGTRVSKPKPPAVVNVPTLVVFQLRSAKTSSVMEVLQRVFGANDVRIAPDATANVIVVRGSKALVDQVGQVVKSLDVPKAIPAQETSDQVTRILPLKFAKADEVSRILVTSVGSGPAVPAIAPDSRTNSLVVTGQARKIAQVMELIHQLDRAPDPEAASESQLKVFALKYANAGALSKILSESFRSKGIESISHDSISNSLIIRAPQSKFDEITDLIRSLDVVK